MYRPKGWNREEREQERARKKVNWYKKNGSESVIFVPATPGSQLQKEYQREVRSQGFKVSVFEKAGESLREML
jgi:reverse gyrase